MLNKKISELGEKLKQFQEERDKIQSEIRESEKNKDILVNDLARIGEQIESFRARRRELEPQMEEIMKELKEAGIDCSTLKAPELSTEEIQNKIQSLQKRMTALEPVNMNAIREYDNQIARKEELDEKIRVLTNERTEINKRMTGYGDAKKEAFMKTYNALSINYKEIFDEIKAAHDQLSSIIQNFIVFPDGFQQKCVTVQQNLQNLKKIETQIDDFIEKLRQNEQELTKQRSVLFSNRGINSWKIKNGKFSDLINRFTITAHKEAAGKIGGFKIEKGAKSGDVTMF